MTSTRRLIVALAGVVALARPVAAQDPLSNAKSLYEAASYSEALTALGQAGNTADVVEVEKYRALCQLALGRPKDAEQSLEHLAMSRPLFTLEGTDVSPRLVALFLDVRKRTLPEAAKQTYERGRASFDAGDMADATKQFKEVVELADTAPPEHAMLMGDLKILAGGFLQLSGASAPRPEAQTAPASMTTVPVKSESPSARADLIYDASSGTVRPPVVVARPFPDWTPPPTLRGMTFQGQLEVVVDEQGNVASATITKSVHALYDELLVRGAKKWRFEPATIEGRPVKFRATYSITLQR